MAAAVIKRAPFWDVQSQCALVALGPVMKGSLDAKQPNDLMKILDVWKTIEKKETATFANVIHPPDTPLGFWVAEQREVFVYASKKYLKPFPLITMTSTDPVHVCKAMCVLASAKNHPHAIVCGAPARLSRYLPILPNRLISSADGTIWSNSLVTCFLSPRPPKLSPSFL